MSSARRRVGIVAQHVKGDGTSPDDDKNTIGDQSSYTYTYTYASANSTGRAQRDAEADQALQNPSTSSTAESLVQQSLLDTDAGRREATHWNGWGFADTHFVINLRRQLMLTGTRYADIFGGGTGGGRANEVRENEFARELPDFVAWAETNVGLNLDDHVPASPPPSQYPDPNINWEFVKLLKTYTDVVLQGVATPTNLDEPSAAVLATTTTTTTTTNVSRIAGMIELLVDGPSRLRRSHGHTCAEIYALHHGTDLPRLPDMIVLPQSHQHVEAIVECASRVGDICLIPFGGGTTVSLAVQLVHKDVDVDGQEEGYTRKCVVMIDTRRMADVKWVNYDNMTASVEAGVLGVDLEERLGGVGVTMGHEPDSIEFSTLGGWVATNSSGMRKNTYGNIEDIVLGARMVTPTGTLEQGFPIERQSVGPRAARLALGSEGCLGVVTEVLVRLRRKPALKVFSSVVFPDFHHGVHAMRAIALERVAPSSVRLLDNAQFKMGQALKPNVTGPKWKAEWADKAKKFYVTQYHGFDPDTMVAMTLLFEGDNTKEIGRQQQALYAVCKRHGGVVGDSASGARGYNLTHMIAYLRDFGIGYNFLSESFETSVPWDKVLVVYDAVLKRVMHEITNTLGVKTPPLVGGRVTQTYDTCAVLYVYFGFIVKGLENPTEAFHHVETAARQTILDHGGSLSHHHGVGKIRKPFANKVMAPTEVQVLRGVKDQLDPQNVFGAGNLCWDANM